MSCCAPGSEDLALGLQAPPSDEEVAFAARDMGDGTRQVELSVPNVHCAGCIHTVESALARLDTVERARVNLSSKRVSVRWRGGGSPSIVSTVSAVGFPPCLFVAAQGGADPVLSELVGAVAVSGLAAGNFMLLSVSVWSGAEGATR